MDWRSCIKCAFVKRVSPDKNLASSLLQGADKKRKAQRQLSGQEFAEPKVGLEYDALRMLLEALALLYGYKIYNHACYKAFLKEVLQDSRAGDVFDNFRRTRNAINYYGKSLSASEAEHVLKEMGDFLETIRSRVDEKLQEDY